MKPGQVPQDTAQAGDQAQDPDQDIEDVDQGQPVDPVKWIETWKQKFKEVDNDAQKD